MGIADWFKSFCADIQIRDVASISRRYRTITKRLNTTYWDTTSDVAHSLYVGSYGRNTAIDITSDMDMIFRLPSTVYTKYDNYITNGQAALLQDVRGSIMTTYSHTNIGASGQVIQVPFTDGITFEVVLGFLNPDGSYTYPDSSSGGSWRTTNPKPEIEAMRLRNGECNGNLVRLCRMMREWKAVWDVPLRGLLIDTLAYQFMQNWEHRERSYFYYDWMCRDFFQFVMDQDMDQQYWKAPGSGQWVYGEKGQFQYKAKRGRNIANEAIEHESASTSREWSAKQKWREIFGTSFPD